MKPSGAQEVPDSTVRAHARKCVHSRVATAPAIHDLDVVRVVRHRGFQESEPSDDVVYNPVKAI